MDTTLLVVAIPVFFLAYQGIGLLLESRSEQKWSSAPSPRKSFSSHKVLQEFSNLSGKIGINKVFLHNQRLSKRLELLLLRSGNALGWKPEDLLLGKEIAALGMVLFCAYIGQTQTILFLMFAAIGFWAPDLYLMGKIKTRQASIQRQLSGFIDLTSLALEGGLDLLATIERILEKMKPSDLQKELALVVQETRLGTPRKEALEHWAYRVNLSDLQSLTSIIIQAEELGTSLAPVLRNYSEDMRNRRILRAEEMAGKAPVKLLFPMMVFFFPIIMAIILGPIALSFFSSYK